MAPAKKKSFVKASALIAAAFLFVVSAGCSPDESARPTLTETTTTTVAEQNIQLSGDCYVAFRESVNIYEMMAQTGISTSGATLEEETIVDKADQIANTLIAGCEGDEQLQGGITQVILDAERTAERSASLAVGSGYVNLAVVCYRLQTAAPNFPQSMTAQCDNASLEAANYLNAVGVSDFSTEGKSGLEVSKEIGDYLTGLLP